MNASDKHEISAVLIVRNEERLVRMCLENLKEAVDEIIVVDQESTDRTVEICRGYTSNIYSRSAKGFPEPDTTFGFSKASSRWILWLAADETLSEELKSHLAPLVRGSYDAYSFPIVNCYFGRPLYHGFTRPVNHVRMYRKG